MISLIVGMGEIGSALHSVLSETYGIDTVYSYDITNGKKVFPEEVDILHICIPYSEDFVDIVREYEGDCLPSFIVVHSSVPVGTTAKIK